MSPTCRGARIRGGFFAKGRAESSRLDEASGGSRRAGASQYGRRRRASGRRHAGSGFASRVVRILHEGRCGVGDRTAVPATSLARLRVFGSEATDYRTALERPAKSETIDSSVGLVPTNALVFTDTVLPGRKVGFPYICLTL
jgi:hypothetical protein